MNDQSGLAYGSYSWIDENGIEFENDYEAYHLDD